MVLETTWNEERQRYEAVLTDEVIEFFDLPYSCFAQEILDEHRWSISKTGVFYDGNLAEPSDRPFRIWWDAPATELQEDMDEWRRHGKIAVLQEMKTKTVTYYGDATK